MFYKSGPSVCKNKKGVAHREERRINRPNSLSNQSLCFSESLTEGAGRSGQWAPLIGSPGVANGGGLVIMAGVAVAPSSTWRSLTLAASILAPLSSLPSGWCHVQTLHLCCGTPMFLHYGTVYTIHFSLYATDNSHLVTNTGWVGVCGGGGGGFSTSFRRPTRLAMQR